MKQSYKFYYSLTWFFLKIIYRFRYEGREQIPEGAALLCANHSDNVDPLLLAYALGRHHPLRIMAKEQISKWPVVGAILSSLDALIWVKRGTSDVGAIKAALKTIKEGRKLLMFPEGTRHDTIGEGKTGAAMLAIRSGVPLIPVYIPLQKRLFRVNTIVIGEAYLPFTEERRANNEDYRVATDELMRRIAVLGGEAR